MIKYDPAIETAFDPFDLKLNKKTTKCLLIFDDEIWEDHILNNKNFKIFPVKNAFDRTFNTYRYLKTNNEYILLVSPTMGAAGSVCEVELLIASGIKKFVALGTCGRLDESLAQNTIIIPTSAYREEGTSYHYLPNEDQIYVDQTLLKITEREFKKHNFIYKKGKIWTTDAVYRETIGKIKLMKKRGCIGVEMELSALLAVAKFRDVKLTEFLIADDPVVKNNTKPLKRQNRKIFNMAIKILNQI